MVESDPNMSTYLSVPKVTVAISLFNYGRFIERAIKSVCEQTIASEVELIIVDDASTDNSLEAVRDFQNTNKSLVNRLASFHCEVHKINKGLAEARNTAFQLASSENILVLDADNFLLPQACACLLSNLTKSPKSVGAAYPILAVQGHSYQSLANELPWNPKGFVSGNYIDAMALVRREAWQKVGGFQHTPGGWEDYDFWCRFVEYGIEARQVPKILAVYQHHMDSMKNSETNLCKTNLCKLLMKRHPWLRLKTH